MTKTYRAAVVGISNIGLGRPTVQERFPALGRELPHSHLAAYAALPNVEVVAACDINPERLNQFRAEWGERLPAARTYADYRELLAREQIDLLSVATSDHRHAQIVIDGAAAGLQGILCEKPIATTLAEADEMIAACERHGVVLSVNHSRRWLAHWQLARAQVGDGPLGKVGRLLGSWVGNRALLFRNGGHLIDTICWFAAGGGPGPAATGQPTGHRDLAGAAGPQRAEVEPEWVVGVLDEEHRHYGPRYAGDGGRNPAVDPGGTALVHFTNGVRAFINCSKRLDGGGVELEVFCERGQLSVDDNASSVLAGSSRGRSHTPLRPIVTSLGETPAAIGGIIAAIEERRQPWYTAHQARTSLAIILGILQSQATGSQPVRFPIVDA